MTRPYPECDSYVCEGCPRRETCDMREDIERRPVGDPEMALPLAINDIYCRITELERDMADIKALLFGMAAGLQRVAQGDD